MNAFYEIVDVHDQDVIQRIAVLSPAEIERIEARGYQVNRRQMSRTLYPWLLGDE